MLRIDCNDSESARFVQTEPDDLLIGRSETIGLLVRCAGAYGNPNDTENTGWERVDDKRQASSHAGMQYSTGRDRRTIDNNAHSQRPLTRPDSAGQQWAHFLRRLFFTSTIIFVVVVVELVFFLALFWSREEHKSLSQQAPRISIL